MESYKLVPYGLTSPKSVPLKTGQTTSYHDYDDGYYQKGQSRSYTILTAGRYSGTTDITINGKTHALSNNCVKDNRTGLMWARYVPTADIGPGADGELFWEPWTLDDKADISFDAASSKITSGAGEFDIYALCKGRKFTVSGSASNDGTYTVSAITESEITVEESLVDEAAGATVSIATVGDLIWDFLEQANTNKLAGYNDWRVPNRFELISILDMESPPPTINTDVFPSAPASYFCTSSTTATTWMIRINFSTGVGQVGKKNRAACFVRLVRG